MKRTILLLGAVSCAFWLNGCSIIKGAGRLVAGAGEVIVDTVSGTAEFIGSPGDWRLWGGDRLERPSLAVGDRWIYHVVETDSSGALARQTEYDLTREIERLPKKEISVWEKSAAFSGQPQSRRYDWHWNARDETGPVDSVIKYSPYRPTFDFPLRAGKTWGQNFAWTKLGSIEEGAARTEAKVVGWEKVTVPVGEFNTMKVELLTPDYVGPAASRLFADRRNSGGMSEIYWYSPELKNVIKYMRKDFVNQRLTNLKSMELINYKVGLRAPAR
jgi:predicted small secreted protein